MNDAKFVLKEPKSKEPTLIYLLFRFNNQKVKYSVGQKVPPKFWNSSAQRVKETKQFPEHETLNKLLDNLSRKAEDTYRDLLNTKKAPTIFKLKDELNKVTFK